ncbi:ATP-binding protein [Streptomyces anulatus]|uniref:ATP-binding protein n=1 Tax=Streptomyces anulatus TaxID=1892 RepID=UPI0033D3190A
MRQSATAHRTPGRTCPQSRRNGPPFKGFEVPHHQPFQAVFLPEPLRVREMRRATKTFLSQRGVPGATIDDAELVVSELVTNAIQHGGGEVGFAISAYNGSVRISVTDASAAPAQSRQVDADSESGRGLTLVTFIVDCWRVSADGTTVHCTLPFSGCAA